MKAIARIDYRVDHKKLEFQKPYTGPIPPGYYRSEQALPPVQCPARLMRGYRQRYSWWDRFCHHVLGTRADFDEETIARGERCNMYDGHWEYPGQRHHINGFGDAWPVTAEDTARLNPDV